MAFIKNLIDLAGTEERAVVMEILQAGLGAVIPDKVFYDNVRFSDDILHVSGTRFKLKDKRVFLIGAGKASGTMAENMVRILGEDRITAGVVISAEENEIGPVRILKGNHPIPSKDSLKATDELLKLKKEFDIGSGDVLINLISGGGSAMLERPIDGLEINDISKTTQIMLVSGANIVEFNTVRKHLSQVKGGLLAKHFDRAQIITLAISDVLGDDPGSIASGPAYPDKTTFEDAAEILQFRNVWDLVPFNVKMALEKGLRGEIEDTPDKLDNVEHLNICTIQDSIKGMSDRAHKLANKVEIITAELQGEPEEAVYDILEGISEMGMGSGIFLWGGETTPNLSKEHGEGGRNQHFGLVLASELLKTDLDWTIGCLATDGLDYMHEAAGCILDNKAMMALDVQLDLEEDLIDISRFIETYDSYSLLKKVDNALIKTGPTGTNVGDIGVLLIK